MSKEYKIKVKTGNIKGAGTDSKIYIKLYDKNGTMGSYHRIDNSKDNFEKGKIEEFDITESKHLSEIRKISVLKDTSGSYEAWYLEWIEVTDKNNNEKKMFSTKSWFSKNDELEQFFYYDINTTSYTIYIKTGLEEYSGTDANVSICMYGTSENSGIIPLDTKKNNFEKGNMDAFNIQLNVDLQEIKGVTLQHDNSGDNPGWFVDYIIIKNNTNNKFWYNCVYRYFNFSQGLSRYLHMKPGSFTNTGKLYWAARDMTDWKVIGNHHLLLIVFNDKNSCKKICREFDLNYKSEKKGSKTTYFITISGYSHNGNTNGLLKCRINNTSDVKAVREFIDPDQHVSWWKPDLDLERHIISPLPESNEEFQIESVIKATLNYQTKLNNVPKYDLKDRNCATWVNSLLRYLGYSKEYREEKGEFSGVDWGEENTISNTYFMTYMT